MNAITRDLSIDAPANVTSAYSSWASTMSSVASTNALVSAIDGYIEQLKHGAYPGLRYIILVGSHEVIPMEARPADNYVENDWNIPAGYLYDIYHAGKNGYYLTDTVYSDLSYYNDGWGTDRELAPELSVGRLVESPSQIIGQMNAFIAAGASMSRSALEAIGSNDYLDGAQAAATFMGSSADFTLNQSGFLSSLIPPKLNSGHSVVYIGGHGDFDWMTTRKWDQGFQAGATGSQGNTEDLTDIPNAVIVAAGCHNGFNMTDMTYHPYDGTVNYGDFPERFANKKVGVYIGSTGYTWITVSGTSKSLSDVGVSERLASLFIDRLLNNGLTTAGKAFQAATNQYMTERGSLTTADRRVISIATFYGIPNYRWSLIRKPTTVISGYYLKNLLKVLQAPSVEPQAALGSSEVTMGIKDWTVSDGVVEIPGASYTGDENYPILPVVDASWHLPGSLTNVNLTWNQAASESTTITNDVPNAKTGTYSKNGDELYLAPKTITLTDFYPSSLAFSSTTSSLGGVDTTLTLSIIPVQYNPATHQTRIWTKLVFDVSYTSDGDVTVDSDGDGLPDYWENSYGLDPNSSVDDNGPSGDPDQDGLTNSQEYQNGTDPMSPDTDHDGAGDGLEIQMGTDPLDPGSTAAQLFLPLLKK